MVKKQASQVRKEKKRSYFLQEISSLIRLIAADEPALTPLFVTRVELSKDTGICYVYFSTFTDKSAFDKGLELLKLYKPSMRKALAQSSRARYVPNLIFRYDETKEKERRVNELLNKIESEE